MPIVHHLNCGTMCPAAQRLVSGEGRIFARGKMVCHCLLIETQRDGLILVDTGFGTADLADPKRFLGVFRAFASPVFDGSETAIAQVRALGYQPEDVRHIVVTHLDLDHAGGLADFPWAKVHVHAYEQRSATLRRSRAERLRYVPEQWAHGPQWVIYEDAGEEWLGLKAIRPLVDGVMILPLFGHSFGHTGVVVENGDRWMLHAGDAFFYHGELETPPSCPVGLRVFQSITELDRRARLENAAKLRELQRTEHARVDIFCAHDPLQLEQMRARTAQRQAALAAI